MLSILPQLLDYQFYGSLLLRLALGAVFLIHGYPKLFKARLRLAGLLESIAGALLVIGLFTQAAAAVLAVELLIIVIWFKRGQKFVGGWEFDFVLLVMALALLVLKPRNLLKKLACLTARRADRVILKNLACPWWARIFTARINI